VSFFDVLAAQSMPMMAWFAWIFAVNFSSVFFLRHISVRWVLGALVANIKERGRVSWHSVKQLLSKNASTWDLKPLFSGLKHSSFRPPAYCLPGQASLGRRDS
jgi:hypothetical protein